MRIVLEVTVIVVAAITLPHLAALVTRSLRQLLCLFSNNSLSVSSTLPRTNFLIFPLITSLLNCTIFLDVACFSFRRMLARNSFYHRLQTMSVFSNLRKLLYLIDFHEASRFYEVLLPLGSSLVYMVTTYYQLPATF